MVEDLTLSNKEEINIANVLKNNTNDFDFIFSLHNLLANNFKQCKTYETNFKLPLLKKRKTYLYYILISDQYTKILMH